MLRLFFGGQLGPDPCRSLIERARADAQRRVEEFRSIRDEVERDDAHAEDRPYWLLTVAAGEQSARAWVDEALEALEQIPPSPDGPHGRST